MQHVTAADRVARNHRDDRFRQRADLALKVEHVQPGHAVRAHVTALAAHALVAARAEGLTAHSGEDDDADRGIVARVGERGLHLLYGLGPERVTNLGAVDRDLRDALGGLRVDDVAIAGRDRPLRNGGR